MSGRLQQAWDRIRPWMDPESRAAWGGAETLQDLGEGGARWLVGEIRSQPGYRLNAGPDPESAALAPALAAANRAGFFTNGSQPGCDGIGYDGQLWQQHAAVEGFVDDETLQRIWAATDGTGLRVTFGRAGRRDDHSQALDGMFGAVLSRRTIRSLYHWCGPAAVAELQDAWQVCVQDPEYAESTRLWAALDRFSGRVPSPEPLVWQEPLQEGEVWAGDVEPGMRLLNPRFAMGQDDDTDGDWFTVAGAEHRDDPDTDKVRVVLRDADGRECELPPDFRLDLATPDLQDMIGSTVAAEQALWCPPGPAPVEDPAAAIDELVAVLLEAAGQAERVRVQLQAIAIGGAVEESVSETVHAMLAAHFAAEDAARAMAGAR